MSSQKNQVLILLGSPRKNGNSAILADKLAAGVKDAGGDPVVVFLQALKISPCNACNACLKNPANGCVIQDDMQSIYPQLKAAHAVVLASPVYWFNYSAQLKTVIDRTYAIQGDNTYALTGKKVGILLTYGDVDLNASGGVNALRSLQDMCRFVKADIVGIVHGSADRPGDITKNTDLLTQAFELGKKMV
jgi:multimeric flavodoxin WrbA